MTLDFERESTVVGFTRGSIPTIFQSSQAVRIRITKNASGSQYWAKSLAAWNQ